MTGSVECWRTFMPSVLRKKLNRIASIPTVIESPEGITIRKMCSTFKGPKLLRCHSNTA